MLHSLNQPVAATIAADRRVSARQRAQRRSAAARPPSRVVRRSAALAAVRLARRLDAEAARHAIAG